MSRQRTCAQFAAALALMSVMFFMTATQAHAQESAPDTPTRDAARATDDKATLDEQLRGLDQNTLRALIDALQRRLDTAPAAIAPVPPPLVPSTTADASVPAAIAALSDRTGGDRFSKYFRTAGIRCRTTRQTTIGTKMEWSSGKLPQT